MNSDKIFSDLNQRPSYPTSHHGGLRRRQILCSMWVQKRNALKQDVRLLGHPQAFGVAKGLALNKSSSTARDMTGLRAHSNHGGSLSTRVQGISVSQFSTETPSD